MQIPANTNVFAQFYFGGHCLPERKNKKEGKKIFPFLEPSHHLSVSLHL